MPFPSATIPRRVALETLQSFYSIVIRKCVLSFCPTYTLVSFRHFTTYSPFKVSRFPCSRFRALYALNFRDAVAEEGLLSVISHIFPLFSSHPFRTSTLVVNSWLFTDWAV